jgi:hypothetical protein
MERQKHGFDYEKKIIAKYKLKKTENYTDEYDAYYKKTPVQIKCIKHKSDIELGSYLRNKNKTQDFILIIGFHKNYKIVNERILYINHLKYTKHLEFGLDTEMISGLKEISNDTSDNVRWQEYLNYYKTEYKKNNNYIDIRFKRDSKTQKRIQCAIPYNNLKLLLCNKIAKVIKLKTF